MTSSSSAFTMVEVTLSSQVIDALLTSEVTEDGNLDVRAYARRFFNPCTILDSAPFDVEKSEFAVIKTRHTECWDVAALNSDTPGSLNYKINDSEVVVSNTIIQWNDAVINIRSLNSID